MSLHVVVVHSCKLQGHIKHEWEGCVVVVHSCKLQGYIKHEWEGYLGDVGQIPPLCNKTLRAWLSKEDKSAWCEIRCKAKNGEDPDTHIYYILN